MKCRINLLPWRLKQHQQQSKILLWKLFGLMLSVLILNIGLYYFHQQVSVQLTAKQENLQQIATQLTQIEQQIVKLRSNHKMRENQLPLATEKVAEILTALSELPLQQGELDELILHSTQIELSGITENQQEFEQLNRFLKNNALFQQVSLSHFTPHQNGSLQFRFTLHPAVQQ